MPAAKTLERDARTGDYYFIMECVDGISLTNLRKVQGGKLPWDDVVGIAAQIAAALDYAHAMKVIHRDVKPSNVMLKIAARAALEFDVTVRAPVTVKMLDFGLAAQIYTSLSRVSRVSYSTSGTAPYMAPEQWLGKYQDAATDQYALAVVIYELLAGHPPFQGHDMRVLGVAVLTGEADAPEGVSSAAWKALRRGLAKKREDRYESCAKLVEALGRHRVAQRVGGWRGRGRGGGRLGRTRCAGRGVGRFAAAVGACAAAAVLAMAWALFWRGGERLPGGEGTGETRGGNVVVVEQAVDERGGLGGAERGAYGGASFGGGVGLAETRRFGMARGGCASAGRRDWRALGRGVGVVRSG